LDRTGRFSPLSFKCSLKKRFAENTPTTNPIGPMEQAMKPIKDGLFDRRIQKTATDDATHRSPWKSKEYSKKHNSKSPLKMS